MSPPQLSSMIGLGAGFLIGLSALLALFGMLEAGSDHAQKVSLLLAIGSLLGGLALRRHHGRRQIANSVGEAAPLPPIRRRPTSPQHGARQARMCRGRHENEQLGSRVRNGSDARETSNPGARVPFRMNGAKTSAKTRSSAISGEERPL
jgi:hypothetical protein